MPGSTTSEIPVVKLSSSHNAGKTIRVPIEADGRAKIRTISDMIDIVNADMSGQEHAQLITTQNMRIDITQVGGEMKPANLQTRVSVNDMIFINPDKHTSGITLMLK